MGVGDSNSKNLSTVMRGRGDDKVREHLGALPVGDVTLEVCLEEACRVVSCRVNVGSILEILEIGQHAR